MYMQEYNNCNIGSACKKQENIILHWHFLVTDVVHFFLPKFKFELQLL